MNLFARVCGLSCLACTLVFLTAHPRRCTGKNNVIQHELNDELDSAALCESVMYKLKLCNAI